MTGLKIKDGHCIRTPANETFVFKLPTDILNPDGLTECLGDLLLSVFRWFILRHSGMIEDL